MKRPDHCMFSLPTVLEVLAAATTEARLAGRGTATLDDVLVSLLAVGGPASRVLARHGAELTALRQAVQERDASDLASIGLDLSGARPSRRQTFTQALQRGGDVLLDPLVTRVLVGGAGERQILCALLTHSSGGPAEALRRCGVDVEAVLADERWESLPVSRRPRPVPGLLEGTREATTQVVRAVPVPYERVVAAVTEAERVSRWIMPGADTAVEDGKIVATMSARGKTARAEVRRVIFEEEQGWSRVAWQSFWVEPALKDSRGLYVCVDLKREGRGTAVRVTQGLNGFGRMAFIGRSMAKVFGGLASRSGVQSIVEVALED